MKRKSSPIVKRDNNQYKYVEDTLFSESLVMAQNSRLLCGVGIMDITRGCTNPSRSTKSVSCLFDAIYSFSAYICTANRA